MAENVNYLFLVVCWKQWSTGVKWVVKTESIWRHESRKHLPPPQILYSDVSSMYPRFSRGMLYTDQIQSSILLVKPRVFCRKINEIEDAKFKSLHRPWSLKNQLRGTRTWGVLREMCNVLYYLIVNKFDPVLHAMKQLGIMSSGVTNLLSFPMPCWPEESEDDRSCLPDPKR